MAAGITLGNQPNDDMPNMPDIPALTTEIQRLSESMSSWNTWIIVGMLAAALSATFLVVVQMKAFKDSELLSKAQDALLKARDANLVRELADKDMQIAQAKERAANAGERAAKAEQETARLNKLAEEERLARIKIEEAVAFRRIPEKQRPELAARLKPFARQTARLWFHAGDHEGALFTNDIAAVLQAADWDVYAPASMITLVESGRRGTTIADTGVLVQSTGDEASSKAADALVHELISMGFDARKLAQPENRTAPLVIITAKSRPEGAQGEAKLRKNK